MIKKYVLFHDRSWELLDASRVAWVVRDGLAQTMLLPLGHRRTATDVPDRH